MNKLLFNHIIFRPTDHYQTIENMQIAKTDTADRREPKITFSNLSPRDVRSFITPLRKIHKS